VSWLWQLRANILVSVGVVLSLCFFWFDQMYVGYGSLTLVGPYLFCLDIQPLVQGKKFLLGQADSQTFTASPTLSVDWEGFTKAVKRFIPPLRPYL
jgi:hypothetical protein